MTSVPPPSSKQRDVAWRPPIPIGHTPYTWGRLTQHIAGPAATFAAAGTAAAATSSSSSIHNTPAFAGPSSSATKTTASPTNSQPLPPTPPSSTPPSRLPANNPTDPCAPTSPSNPLLPLPNQRNILITSALPYVNNVPHLGNLIGAVLSADVYARYCRLRGYNVVYVCGTDEYGTATETKAIEAGKTPQEICDYYHAIHADIYKWFDISFDYFGRTTTTQQTEIAQDIFNKCDQNGYLLADELEQLYCEKDQRYLADRFVEGTCPNCQFPDARGDQCDGCGKLLNAIELVNPLCKLCKTSPIVRRSNHLFLDLGKLQHESLSSWVNKQQVDGKWTDNAINITKAWLDGGLKPRCITRDLKWGTPVPKAGYQDKVFYVWFDAPIGYISITANYVKEWELWWKNPENVQLYQFMGKDNVPFHCVIFPASLQATREPWTLLHHINATEYLNYEMIKFSKSRNTGVFGDDARTTGIPSDVWRYYMLHNRPEGADTFFLWEDMQAKNNSELLNNVGNFINRTLMFIKNSFGGVLPAYGSDDVWTDEDKAFMANITAAKREYVALLEEVKIKDALKVAMGVSSTANAFMQHKQPWELFKRDKLECSKVVNVSVNLIYLLAVLLHPYMPALSQRIGEQLNYLVHPRDLAPDDTAQATTSSGSSSTTAFHLVIQPGHVFGTPSPLFRKIEDAEVVQYRAKFGGVEEKKRGADWPLRVVVGEIRHCEQHADAAHLYVCRVAVGEEAGGERQVVAGLKQRYSMEELVGRKVLVLLNLKPTLLKGARSEGLLLTSMKKVVSLLSPERPADVRAGSVVVPVDCVAVEQDKMLDWTIAKKGLPMETVEGGKASFGGLLWKTEEGVEVLADNKVQGAKIQ